MPAKMRRRQRNVAGAATAAPARRKTWRQQLAEFLFATCRPIEPGQQRAREESGHERQRRHHHAAFPEPGSHRREGTEDGQCHDIHQQHDGRDLPRPGHGKAALLEITLHDIVQVDLLLVAVLLEERARLDIEDALAPTDFLERHQSREGRKQNQEVARPAQRLGHSEGRDQCEQCGEEEQDRGQLLDRTLLPQQPNVDGLALDGDVLRVGQNRYGNDKQEEHNSADAGESISIGRTGKVLRPTPHAGGP